jgi:type II secretory pathway component PulF
MKNKEQEKKWYEKEFSLFGVSLTQKVLFTKHLSIMLRASLTIPEALEIILAQVNGRLKSILEGVLSSVRRGGGLADSLSQYPKDFSGFFIDVIRAGEYSGNLRENLMNISEQLKKERDLVKKIKGAMFYPLIVLFIAFSIGLAMSFFVLPQIIPLFEGIDIELPTSTKILIWFSRFMRDYGGWVVVGSISLTLFLLWFLRQKFIQPFTHWFLIHIPFVKKIVKYSNLARFCRTSATLLKSGLSMQKTLEITTRTVDNYYYKKSLQKVTSYVVKGQKITDSLSDYSDLYPGITTQMIKVGEESGQLEETLMYLANFYEEEVDDLTKSIPTIVEPIMLIVIGLVVAFLALSIITPIYEITGNL